MKLVIITGASSGLGEEVANIHCDLGDQVINISRRVCKHPKVINHLCDLNNVRELESFFCNIVSKTECEEICLINNAGIIEPMEMISKLETEQVIININVDLIAPIILSNELLRSNLRSNKYTKIINISSGVAMNPLPACSIYSLSKAALESFTKSLEMENVDNDAFQVYALSPGIIDTNMQATIRSADRESFPDVEKFINFKKNGELRSPAEVAKGVSVLIQAKKGEFTTFLNIRELVS